MLTTVHAEYNLSFTAASLRPELARIVAECYLKMRSWDLTKDYVLRANALQCRSTSSAIRLERELRRRLERLTEDEMVILAGENADDRAAIAWLATLKHTQLAFDFTTEVLREKLAIHDPVLRRSDYEAFVDSKSLIHSSLNHLKTSSRSKIRQVLLLMLSEAGMLGVGTALGTIQRPVLSPAVLRAITADRPRWLAGFLFSDAEIGGQ
jgi:bacteriophage exclusion system BrxA-like protein